MMMMEGVSVKERLDELGTDGAAFYAFTGCIEDMSEFKGRPGSCLLWHVKVCFPPMAK